MNSANQMAIHTVINSTQHPMTILVIPSSGWWQVRKRAPGMEEAAVTGTLTRDGLMD